MIHSKFAEKYIFKARTALISTQQSAYSYAKTADHVKFLLLL